MTFYNCFFGWERKTVLSQWMAMDVGQRIYKLTGKKANMQNDCSCGWWWYYYYHLENSIKLVCTESMIRLLKVISMSKWRTRNQVFMKSFVFSIPSSLSSGTSGNWMSSGNSSFFAGLMSACKTKCLMFSFRNGFETTTW